MLIRPLLLGHRGLRAEKTVPENTFASFDLALARGCDGFEFDVRLSADGRPVICHDADIRGLNVAQTSSKRLCLLLLEEVLQRYQTSAFLDIELKVPGLESITIDLIRAKPPDRGYVISSFIPEVLARINADDGEIPLGLICETLAQLSRWTELPVQYVILHSKLAQQEVISEIHDAGKKVFVWTVNSSSAVKRLVARGVNGIISDFAQDLSLPLSPK
jgi:glycerophosphoryl diester phosphodiesterase